MFEVELMELAFRASCIDDGRDNEFHDEDRLYDPYWKGTTITVKEAVLRIGDYLKDA